MSGIDNPQSVYESCPYTYCLSVLHRAKWIKVHGTMYKRHCAVVVGIQNDGLLPEFGKVEDILVADNELYFHVQLCLTMKYSEHYHALVFVTRKDYRTITQTELLSHIPLHICSVTGLTRPGEKAVILKHHISTL